MDSYILPIESIQERDVDLIILEELSANNDFCKWLTRELELPQCDHSNGAWRSISEFGLGETDILFSYKSEYKTVYLLIENKLDASFQDNQSQRYIQRLNEYIKSDKCHEAFSILIAPKLYCENQNEFENYITYESIATWFESSGNKRSVFKSKLLHIAAEKLRRGYHPVNSEPVQKFWHSYWRYIEEKYPHLKMRKPAIVPHGSDWPEMRDKDLHNIIFFHKLQQGNVDATFCDFPKEIEIKIKDLIPENAEFVRHSKRFSIRYKVPEIDRTKDFEEQQELVELALEKIESLRTWIKVNIVSK